MIVLVLAVAGGAVPGLFSDDSADRPDDPTTEDTVGYVEGYWYDDDLAVDDRDNAVVEDDELEAVVYRSMARVERIRNLTYQDDVPVEVVSREEFQESNDELFIELDENEQVAQNVTFEALFMVDNETDAGTELEAMYGDSVGGYYDPETDEIVLVSDSPESPELDEVILGHELVHALQDQHFDLERYDRETIDQDNAKNGLVEGDAVWVETEYDDRCGDEWDCLPPAQMDHPQPDDLNFGIYMTLIQPYQDGPAYIDHLLEADDGWSAVNAAYDDSPTSSSEVIHPGEDRDPVNATVDDQSADSWQPLEADGEPVSETVGEAGMVSMFGADVHDDSQPSVISPDALLTADLAGYDYDQPYTDGWAGDELVTYVESDAEDPEAADSGYVWQTEWRSSEDAQQFVTGYLELLELHDADPVDDRQDTYVIDEEYPGAYFLEHDGETVRIVRAPSVDALDEIDDGAAPDGADTLERTTVDDGDENDDGSETDDSDDSLAGFGAPGAVVAVAIVSIVLITARTRR